MRQLQTGTVNLRDSNTGEMMAANIFIDVIPDGFMMPPTADALSKRFTALSEETDHLRRVLADLREQFSTRDEAATMYAARVHKLNAASLWTRIFRWPPL